MTLVGFFASFRDSGTGDPPGVQVSASSRGAALGREPEANLLDAPEVEPVWLQTRTAPTPASVSAPSMAELNMILKTLQSMVPEFPKLELGQTGTRPCRLQQWLLTVTQALVPAGHHVMSWWQWICAAAEKSHGVFLIKPLDQREAVSPGDAIPAHLMQVESWLRPRILACLPKSIRE